MTTNYSAIRYRVGKQWKVKVFQGDNPDAVVGILGGSRAERAQAVIVVKWPGERETPGVYGVRGDLHAAQFEAHRLVHQTERISRSRYTRQTVTIPLNTCEWAIAVPVVAG